VVGLAGGRDRCTWTRQTLGIADCIDYRVEDLQAELSRAFPGGIDMFSDGVGGRLTAITSRLMKERGRVFSYGTAGSFYGATIEKPDASQSMRERFGISGEIETILRDRKVRIESWIVDRFYHRRIEADDVLSTMLMEGSLKPINHVVDGFEKLPEAIVGLYKTPRAGKLQIRFLPDPKPRNPAK
jgi:NADPH-dependent curcumin reductase